jgi:uncharacterized damage-inducible protein DinB
MADRGPPAVVAGERATLVAFLDYLRESLAAKAEGVADEDGRRPLVPSGTSLFGIVKHLATVERFWFDACFGGGRVPGGDRALTLEAGQTGRAVVADYRSAIARSNEVIANCADLDERCRAHRPELTLRWVLVHMIEETARHAGHADILREELDGATGR